MRSCSASRLTDLSLPYFCRFTFTSYPFILFYLLVSLSPVSLFPLRSQSLSSSFPALLLSPCLNHFHFHLTLLFLFRLLKSRSGDPVCPALSGPGINARVFAAVTLAERAT